jgi:hypothetical protein
MSYLFILLYIFGVILWASVMEEAYDLKSFFHNNIKAILFLPILITFIYKRKAKKYYSYMLNNRFGVKF